MYNCEQTEALEKIRTGDGGGRGERMGTTKPRREDLRTACVKPQKPKIVGNFLIPSTHPTLHPRHNPFKVHIMATMAAAVAASLPTVQAASTPAVPTKETLPASWNKRVDTEAQIPITTVQIDGLVCLDGLG